MDWRKARVEDKDWWGDVGRAERDDDVDSGGVVEPEESEQIRAFSGNTVEAPYFC